MNHLSNVTNAPMSLLVPFDDAHNHGAKTKYWTQTSGTWFDFCNTVYAYINDPQYRIQKNWADLTDEEHARIKQMSPYVAVITQKITGAANDENHWYEELAYGKIKTYRKKAQATERTAITLDIDELTDEAFAELIAKVQAVDFALLVHSSYNHKRKAFADGSLQNRVRIVVPFARPVHVHLYETCARWVAAQLGITAIDPTCLNVNQPMYYPHVALDDTTSFVWYDCAKRLLCDRMALTLNLPYDNPMLIHKFEHDALTIQKNEQKAQKVASRKKAALTDKQVDNAIDLIKTLKFDDVMPLLGLYSPDGDKWLWHESTTGVAGGHVTVMDDGNEVFTSQHGNDGVPSDGGYNMVDFLIHFVATDESTPKAQLRKIVEWCAEHIDGFTLTVNKIKSDSIMQATKMQVVRTKKATDVLFEQATESQQVPDTTLAIHTENDKIIQQRKIVKIDENEYHDHNQCQWTVMSKTDKDGNVTVTPMVTVSDIINVLTTHPQTRGRIYYDRFDMTTYAYAPLPIATHAAKQYKDLERVKLTDVDYHALTAWLQQLSVHLHGETTAKSKITESMVRSACDIIAESQSQHRLDDYLEVVQGTWDGVPRIDTLFVDYMGADDNAYTRLTARHMILAMIGRAVNHNRGKFYKHDAMVILSGSQGIGKSQFFSRLTGGLTTEAVTDLTDIKVVGEKTTGKWICNLDEMVGVKGKPTEALKNTITATELNYRPAYARTVRQQPPCHIYVGTTNEPAIIDDVTGGRRYHLIDCDKEKATKSVFTDMPPAIINQWFAEGIDMLMRGEKSHIEKGVNEEYDVHFAIAQERIMMTDRYGDMVREIIKTPYDSASQAFGGTQDDTIDAKITAGYAKYINVDVVCEALGMDKKSISDQTYEKIERAIKQLPQYTQSKKVARDPLLNNGKSTRYYVLDDTHPCATITPLAGTAAQIERYRKLTGATTTQSANPFIQQ